MGHRVLSAFGLVVFFIVGLSVNAKADLENKGKHLDSFTVRYVWLTMEPLPDKKGNVMPIMPVEEGFPLGGLDGSNVTMETTPEKFVEEVRAVWPGFKYQIFKAGSFVCRNGDSCRVESGSRQGDEPQTKFEALVTPMLDRSDGTITLQCDGNISFLQKDLHSRSNTDRIGVASAPFSSITKMKPGRTYTIGIINSSEPVKFGPGEIADPIFPARYTILAACILHGKMPDFGDSVKTSNEPGAVPGNNAGDSNPSETLARKGTPKEYTVQLVELVIDPFVYSKSEFLWLPNNGMPVTSSRDRQGESLKTDIAEYLFRGNSIIEFGSTPQELVDKLRKSWPKQKFHINFAGSAVCPSVPWCVVTSAPSLLWLNDQMFTGRVCINSAGLDGLVNVRLAGLISFQDRKSENPIIRHATYSPARGYQNRRLKTGEGATIGGFSEFFGSKDLQAFSPEARVVTFVRVLPGRSPGYGSSMTTVVEPYVLPEANVERMPVNNVQK